MLLVMTEVALLAGYVDRRVCAKSPEYKNIPELDRILAVLWVMSGSIYVRLREIRGDEAIDKLAIVEFGGDAEEFNGSTPGLPYRSIVGWRPAPSSHVLSFTETVAEEIQLESCDGCLLEDFWSEWQPVLDCVDSGDAIVDGWSREGRLRLKGKTPSKPCLPIARI